METIKQLAYTPSSSTQGTALTSVYGLQPVLFLKELLDAAKKRLFFTQAAYVKTLPVGHKDAVLKKRKAYIGSSGMTWVTSEADSNIGLTTIDNLDSVQITPSIKNARVAITNYNLRTNSVNLIEAAREELVYAIGDKLDAYVATKLGDATAATSSARGAQTIYGGDATGDDSQAGEQAWTHCKN